MFHFLNELMIWFQFSYTHIIDKLDNSYIILGMNRRERFTSENRVNNSPDRLPVTKMIITGGLKVNREDQLVVEVIAPLSSPRVVRGHTIGGGTSKEALRRARKHLGRKNL